MSLSALRAVIITGLLFILALVGLSHSQWIFHVLFPRLERPVYRRVSFFELTASHTGLVLIATGLAAVIAIALAVIVTRPFGKRLKPLVLAVAVVGQTFPPVAVLAVTIPLLGYGAGPTEVALFAYALLPIFLNTVAGLEGNRSERYRSRRRHGPVTRPAPGPTRPTAGRADHARWNPDGGDD